MSTNRFKKMNKNDVKEIVGGTINSNSEKELIKNEDIKDIKNEIDNKKEYNPENRRFGVSTSVKEEIKNFTMTIPKKLYDVIENEVKTTNGKRNALVKNVLEEVYDPNTLEFTINIEKKEATKTEALPVALPEHLSNALEKVSERTNKSKSEVFVEILERFLNGER